MDTKCEYCDDLVAVVDAWQREGERLTARLTVLAGVLERIHAIANVSGDMSNPTSAIAKIEATARAALGAERA